MRKWTDLLGVAGVVGLVLTGCTSQAMKVESPDEAIALANRYPSAPDAPMPRRAWDPVTTPSALSYCYSKQINTPEDLLALAREDCKGGKLSYYGQDLHVRECPLLQTYRMTFICIPDVPAQSSQ